MKETYNLTLTKKLNFIICHLSIVYVLLAASGYASAKKGEVSISAMLSLVLITKCIG